MISWRLWAKALGEKMGSDDSEADQVAKIRTLFICISLGSAIFNMFVGIAIVAGIVRHWNVI